jgi:hypothetical protein
MQNRNTMKDQSARFMRLVACGGALAAALALALPQPARAVNVTPPSAPGLEVDAGNKPFLVGHAVGTQNYVCLPSGGGFAWTLFTPQATLFNDDGKELITHFFGPNPDPSEKGTIRAAWQDSRDTSTVWAKVIRDPVVVTKGAIAWLLLEKAGVLPGPAGGDTLTKTTFVQRVNTSGGVAPETGCSQSSDVGAKAFVPYTADYFFYMKDDGQ